MYYMYCIYNTHIIVIINLNMYIISKYICNFMLI